MRFVVPEVTPIAGHGGVGDLGRSRIRLLRTSTPLFQHHVE